MSDEETITIDVDKLRKEMREECMGGYFVGGYGGALVESFDINKSSPERLVDMAQKNGVDLRKYSV